MADRGRADIRRVSVPRPSRRSRGEMVRMILRALLKFVPASLLAMGALSLLLRAAPAHDYQTELKNRLALVNDEVSHKAFRANWNSLGRYQVPDWFRDAKFGIFIHWGVYSVPAFGSEWYPRQMYLAGSEENQHHVSVYGPVTKFGYKDFIPLFKAQHYDPQAWAHLFKESGARYVVPVFEHHDGFQMYDSNLSDWTAG